MRIKAQDISGFLDGTLSLTIDDALSMALTEVNDNTLSNDVYENMLGKLGETEQAAFTMGLVDKGIEVMSNINELTELKNAFTTLANKQGCVYEDDYHRLCYGKNTMMISKVCDWLLSAGVPLQKNKPKGIEPLRKKKPISDEYKDKVTNQVKHPNVRSIKGKIRVKVSSLENLNVIEDAKDKDVETNYLPQWKKMEKGKVLFAGKEFSVRIAKTLEDLSSGLEIVSSLEKDEGMLFPFEPADHVTFHMGKVKFPIDIVFLTDSFEELKVAKIIHNAQPGALESWSHGKTAYVLEIPGGSCKEHNININDAYEIGKV